MSDRTRLIARPTGAQNSLTLPASGPARQAYDLLIAGDVDAARQLADHLSDVDHLRLQVAAYQYVIDRAAARRAAAANEGK